jgi:hypothetical protein
VSIFILLMTNHLCVGRLFLVPRENHVALLSRSALSAAFRKVSFISGEIGNYPEIPL